MLGILKKVFIKSDDTSDPKVRCAYGTLCSVYGIFLNVLLFAGKILCGMISGSIAIIADSFNNLADAGSSVITLFGFQLASKKPDTDHPFGHGRFEYISGLIVSFAIILMGFELVKSSVSSIIDPEPVTYSVLSMVILSVSVLVKIYMSLYNRNIGKKISSAAMIATSKDSLSDAVSTAVLLVVTLIAPFLPFQIDGWAGLCVAVLIIWAGIGSARDTISPLLGQQPDPEFVSSVECIVMSHGEVCGIHDLVVHDYGPGRVMISLHAEVPASMDIDIAHDVIDNIEVELTNELNCHATIHMDPVNTDDPETVMMKNKVAEIVSFIDRKASMHDFRVVLGKSHTNLIFDVVIPFDTDISDDEFVAEIRTKVREISSKYNCVVRVDKDYTGH